LQRDSKAKQQKKAHFEAKAASGKLLEFLFEESNLDALERQLKPAKCYKLAKKRNFKNFSLQK
jgi:hypothetical protein